MKASVLKVNPSPKASKLLKGYSGFDRPHFPKNGLGAPGTGSTLPSRTGQPWPGGGKVPPPDTGNQDARRVSLNRPPAGAVNARVAGATIHVHPSLAQHFA